MNNISWLNALMNNLTIGRLIGYGILIFFVGEFGQFFISSLSIAKVPGFLMTTYGIFLWFKNTDMSEEFKHSNEDYLTYFWDKIVLKLWTIILFTWMMFSMLFWILGGTFN